MFLCVLITSFVSKKDVMLISTIVNDSWMTNNTPTPLHTFQNRVRHCYIYFKNRMIRFLECINGVGVLLGCF